MSNAPALYTSWRDERDGTVVEVVEVRHWNKRIALLPPGGQGYLRVDVGERSRVGSPIRRLDQWVFDEHFTLVYDPHTGFDAAAPQNQERQR